MKVILANQIIDNLEMIRAEVHSDNNGNIKSVVCTYIPKETVETVEDKKQLTSKNYYL